MSLLIDIEHRSFEETLQRCADLGGADLLFFSPPYPTEKPGASGAAGAPTRDYGGDAPKHLLWDDYQRLGDCCYRALKPGGFCIIILDGPVRTLNKAIGSERSTVAFRLAEDWRWTPRHDGLRFRYVEHEAYVRDGMPGRFYPRRRAGWEPMHVFQRPGKPGFFDPKGVCLPAASFGKSRRTRPEAKSWVKMRAPRESRLFYAETRSLTTAIKCAPTNSVTNYRLQDNDHPAPFTGWIAGVQVASYSPPGGLVCDPFNGSGTTGIAAVKHGRNFVGGDLGAREKDGRRWADIGRERALEAAGLPPEPREAPDAERAARLHDQLSLL